MALFSGLHAYAQPWWNPDPVSCDFHDIEFDFESMSSGSVSILGEMYQRASEQGYFSWLGNSNGEQRFAPSNLDRIYIECTVQGRPGPPANRQVVLSDIFPHYNYESDFANFILLRVGHVEGGPGNSAGPGNSVTTWTPIRQLKDEAIIQVPAAPVFATTFRIYFLFELSTDVPGGLEQRITLTYALGNN